MGINCLTADTILSINDIKRDSAYAPIQTIGFDFDEAMREFKRARVSETALKRACWARGCRCSDNGDGTYTISNDSGWRGEV